MTEQVNELQISGAMLIAAERARQITVEGFDAAHDNVYANGELASAAIAYAAPTEELRQGWWPEDWAGGDYKRDKHDRIKQLAIAGSLIAAEIDRLQRAEAASEVKAAG